MFESPSDAVKKRLAELQERNREFGTELCDLRAARRIFAEVLGPDLKEGFSLDKKGRYVAVLSPDITQLVELHAMKGQSYMPWWGVSLSFVPHEWKRTPRWHRTPASARLDLFEAPGVAGDPYPLRAPLEGFSASGLHGERFFAQALHRVWSERKVEICSWLSLARTLDGILARAREQVQRGVRCHAPPPKLMVAFVLARLGRKEEGVRELESAIVDLGLAPVSAQGLRGAFAIPLERAVPQE